MYKSNLVKKIGTAGEIGVFTTTSIPANVPILEFNGDLFTRETLQHEMGRVMQISHNSFLGPSGDFDDYINHSCNPNCAVKIVGRRTILFSLYLIPADTELTWDYSTTSTDTPEQWSMECKCGSHNCRKMISGFHSLDEKTKADLLKKNMIPMFITNPIFKS